MVVLVDADDEPWRSRESLITQALDGLGAVTAVGVAVKEFETWLIADGEATRDVLGGRPATSGRLEGLEPGTAKRSLAQLMASSGTTAQPHQLRRSLASVARLDQIGRRCPAFRRFRSELAAGAGAAS